MKVMNIEELSEILERMELSHWRIKDGKLNRTIEFKDFKQAISFMVHLSLWIDQTNHHPEWKNVYNRLEIDLITHDVNGVTQRDLDLANLLEETLTLYRI
jgi:4a-hydroxytetrahydrobiopterin dehydratase